MSYKDFTVHFQKMAKLGEGSYGEVFLCAPRPNYASTNQQSDQKQNTLLHCNMMEAVPNPKGPVCEYFAAKKLKMRQQKSSYYEEDQPMNVEQVKQIQIMKLLNHQNLIEFKQILMHDKEYKKNYYLLLPFGIEVLEFAKQKEILLSKSLRKTIVYQIISGFREVHAQGVLHRDVKPDNIFLMKNGVVKIGDFSLSRKKPELNSANSMVEQSQQAPVKLSGNVTTRYYRAPEIMYGSRHYDQKIDIWSLGCTIAQLILHQPIFPGQTDINQLQLIFKTVGYPQQQWPKANELPYYLEFSKDQQEIGLRSVLPDIEPELLEVIEACLQLDPERRRSCEELLGMAYFADVEGKSLELEKLAVYLHEKKLKELVGKKG